MEITVQQAALLVTAATALTGFLTFMGVRRRDQAKEAEQKGKDKAALNGVVKDVLQIMEIEVPIMREIRTQTLLNAQQLGTLSGKVDDLRDLHQEREERQRSFVDAVDGLVTEMKKRGS